MAKINKKEIIEAISEEAYISIKDAQTICNIVFDNIKKYLLSGNEVDITNFGSFKSIEKSARIGTNPNTHMKMNIPATRTVVFHPSIGFKKEINK